MRFKITISHGESDTLYGLFDSHAEDTECFFWVRSSQVRNAYVRLNDIRNALNLLHKENIADA